MEVKSIGVEFKKPPVRFLWFTFCRHEWKTYWKEIGPGVQQTAQKCVRCEKDKR